MEWKVAEKKEKTKDTKQKEVKKVQAKEPTNNTPAAVKAALDAEEAYLRSLPLGIVMQVGQEPFDILECLRKTKVEGLTIGQLLQSSTSIRKRVQNSLKTIPRETKTLLIDEFPSLGFGEKEFTELAVLLNRVERSQTNTHGFKASIMGTPLEVLLDGGSCVNVVKREFLDKAGITNRTQHSMYTLKGLTGRAGVVGEAPEVPVNINNVTITVGCVIVESLDFDILLGRPFLESTNASTKWNSAITRLRVQGFNINIDGRARSVPEVSRYIPKDKEAESSEDEASALEEEESNSDQESEQEDDDPDGTETDPYEPWVRLILAEGVEPISEEQLLEDETQDLVVDAWLLQADCLDPFLAFRPLETYCLSVDLPKEVKEPPSNFVDTPSPPIQHFSQDNMPRMVINNSYGFHLEAPRCRDRLLNTPVMLLPGLEEHSIYVGDIPEVHEHLAEIQSLFTKHKGCFPLAGGCHEHWTRTF